MWKIRHSCRHREVNPTDPPGPTHALADFITNLFQVEKVLSFQLNATDWPFQAL